MVQKSRQPLVAGWFKMLNCSYTLPSFLSSFGERFTLPPTPSPDPGNSPARGVRASYCAFFAILVTFFFSSLVRCLFGSIFARFSTPTCLRKSNKIAQKSMPRCLPMLASFFDRFLIDFCSISRSLEPQNLSKL